ncbi:GNAT family N-acetyltransferase [Kitasatospora sp. NPDC002965]|uniref:GNAT family N-acetyltransferase n=1 Tax=Kitasatospora sp. NPDC002965 TaxID=3154775 RepID=UPI0033B32D45
MTSTRAPEATTPAIALVPLDVDDAESLYSWRSDPVAAHELGHWPRPLSAVRERIEQDVEDSDHGGFLVALPDGTPVGSAVLANQGMVDGLACVRFLVVPERRGHGYGAAALDALVDLAFGELPLHRLEAIPHTTNAPGLATLARTGRPGTGPGPGNAELPPQRPEAPATNAPAHDAMAPGTQPCRGGRIGCRARTSGPTARCRDSRGGCSSPSSPPSCCSSDST